MHGTFFSDFPGFPGFPELVGTLYIGYKISYILNKISYILREKSLAIYFGDSQFKRNRTFNFIVSKIYVDKRSQVR